MSPHSCHSNSQRHAQNSCRSDSGSFDSIVVQLYLLHDIVLVKAFVYSKLFFDVCKKRLDFKKRKSALKNFLVSSIFQ